MELKQFTPYGVSISIAGACVALLTQVYNERTKEVINSFLHTSDEGTVFILVGIIIACVIFCLGYLLFQRVRRPNETQQTNAESQLTESKTVYSPAQENTISKNNSLLH